MQESCPRSTGVALTNGIPGNKDKQIKNKILQNTSNNEGATYTQRVGSLVFLLQNIRGRTIFYGLAGSTALPV